MKMLDAAEQVLQDADAPMHYMAIWDEMAKQGQKSKGKTPWHTVRAMMGRAPERFDHLEGGRFQLAKKSPPVQAPPRTLVETGSLATEDEAAIKNKLTQWSDDTVIEILPYSIG